MRGSPRERNISGLCSCHLRLQPSCSFQAPVANGAYGALRLLCMSCSSAVIPAAAAAVTVIAAAIPRSAHRCGSTALRKIRRVPWSRRSLPRPARALPRTGTPTTTPHARFSPSLSFGPTRTSPISWRRQIWPTIASRIMRRRRTWCRSQSQAIITTRTRSFGYFNPDAQGGRHGRVRGAA